MTPRESLEAAGWVEVWQRWFSPDQSDMKEYSKAEALAQLARDEAKETSDGGAHNSQTTGGDSGPTGRANPASVDSSVPAPVATSVSAPDLVKWAHDEAESIWRTSRSEKSHELAIWPGTYWIEQAIIKVAERYASSSSAALFRQDWIDAINGELSNLREWANTEAKRAEAAEGKCAELESQVKQFGKVLVAGHAILDSAGIPDKNIRPVNPECDSMLVERLALLRDSRDRLQEALRVAANHLHYVGQEQAAGQARAALGDPK